MHKRENPIDLASSSSKEARSHRIYMCPTCGFSLVPDEASKRNSPYLGSPYWCNSCNKVWDSSTMKLKAVPRQVQGSVSREEKPMVMFVDENKGNDNDKAKGRTYESIDPEKGFDDERWKSIGAEIVDSRVELTDSAGHTQTFVKDKPQKPDRFRPITQLD